MGNSNPAPSTEIGHADADSITVRGEDLVEDVMGATDFTSFFYFHLTGDQPTDEEKRMFDVMLVTLVEHGITPSVIAARSTNLSAPESLQGAVASGILGAGDTYLGSMENTAMMLKQAIAESTDVETTIDDIARETVVKHEYVPGLGHPIHKPEDPRTERLFEIADELGFHGEYVELLRQIQEIVQDETGQTPVPINASGAIGAIIAEMGLPASTGRGISIVARTAGLIGHISEEEKNPIAQDIWNLVDDTVEYKGNR